MKRFLRNIGYYLGLLAIAVLAICHIPISDEAVIAMTEHTAYEKIAWNLRLLKQPERINGKTIFIGPSFVQAGIDDSLITAKGIPAVNMGVNHPGYDMDHYFVNRILKEAKPGKVYLYRPENGGAIFHPMIAMMMTPWEYINTVHQFPTRYLYTYIPKRLYFVIKSWITHSIKKKYTPQYGVRNNTDIGVEPTPNPAVVKDAMNLRNEFATEMINADGSFHTNSVPKQYWRKFLLRYKGAPEPVHASTMALLTEHNIPFGQIYMPMYTDATIDQQTDKRDYYKKVQGDTSKVITLDNYIFLDDHSFWMDYHHLNNKGAQIFSDSLSKHL